MRRDSWLMHDLYNVSIITLVIVCTYPAWYIWVDRSSWFLALASSSKELYLIVNTHSIRHRPKILPTIYPSADLPSFVIKHLTNKVEKPRANIASEHVTSTLVTGTTAATFSSFEKVSQLIVKECILIFAPKSCELDPIPYKLLI